MTPFADLGARLREARTEQNLQRAELAERTGLPERYLEALEAGDISALPNEVYARIYFFSYARELGLNTEELLLDWPEPDVSQPEVITESAAPPRWPLRAAAALIAVAVVIWIVVQLRGTEDEAGEPPVQPIADPGEPIPFAWRPFCPQSIRWNLLSGSIPIAWRPLRPQSIRRNLRSGPNPLAWRPRCRHSIRLYPSRRTLRCTR